MEVKVVKNKGKVLKVSVKEINVGMANAIRRVAYGEIPVMAVGELDITANNSGLVDEILAHRFGMIPLVWPTKGYNLPSECKCSGKGCSNCEVKLSVKKEGPAMVYSGDLKSDDKEVHPDDPKIPIVELLEHQKVDVVAYAKLGFGKYHAKHQASIVGYTKGQGGFTFNIESSCGLTGAEVFARTLDVISERAEEFTKLIKKEL